MRLSKIIRPSNSIVFVHGEPTYTWPLPIWGARILATNCSLSITCMPEVDGPTEIVLGDSNEVGLDRKPDYQGIFKPAGGRVLITTVEGDVVTEMPSNKFSVLKVWRNHPFWPDIVTVGIEGLNDGRLATQMMLPNDTTTTTTIEFAELVPSIFLSDGSLPSRHRDFNPWQHPEFLTSGRLLDVGARMELTVVTDVPHYLVKRPDLDFMIETPSREIQIFDSLHERALLKIDVTQVVMRVRIWIDRSTSVANITIVVTESPR